MSVTTWLSLGKDRGLLGAVMINIMTSRRFLSVIIIIFGLLLAMAASQVAPTNISESNVEPTSPLENFKIQSITDANCLLSEGLLPRRTKIKWFINANPIGINMQNILGYLRSFIQISFDFDKRENVLKTNTVKDCLILNGAQPNSLFSRTYLRGRNEEVVTQLLR